MSDENKNIEDTKLWEYITRDILPLNNKNKIADINKSEILTGFSNKESDIFDADLLINTSNKPKYPRSNEIDYNTERRLKRGKIPIDSRVDLHGMTQIQAYDCLLSFIPSAYNAGKRCVLVITGKGGWQSADASIIDKEVGVLRQKTPIWLSEMPLNEYILKVKTARPNHGGEGALYVLLRNNRK